MIGSKDNCNGMAFRVPYGTIKVGWPGGNNPPETAYVPPSVGDPTPFTQRELARLMILRGRWLERDVNSEDDL